MRAVWSWLRELARLERDVTAEEGAAALTAAGLEVEAIERLGDEFSGVVVAEVAATRPHPSADKLTLVEVRDRAGGPVTEVVCGAPNVPAPGGRVLWARPGAVLPGGLEIGTRALKGVESAGMLCAESELGIGDDSDGIVVLAGAEEVGAEAQRALGLRETVFDISVPANRADVLGHIGLARELAALVGGRIRRPKSDVTDVAWDREAARLARVEVEDPEGCPRYVARVIDGVTWGPSPRWMQARLRAVGVRPLANVVDITNYVMFELGQPLHAFDAERVIGAVRVRRARPGERITTLDDTDRPLEPEDLVIADDEGPIALAGVMGGERTEASPATTRVLLESASFAPAAIRRTARRLGLHSESSHRFERGVDPNAADRASARAARLLAEFAGGRVAVGSVDAYPRPRGARTVPVRASRTSEITGVDIGRDQIGELLARLDLAVKPGAADDVLEVSCPTFRPDLEREIDLVEEVLRLHGFDKVPATLPRTATPPTRTGDPRPGIAREALVTAGLSEAITFGFTSREKVEALGHAEGDPRRAPLALVNPMTVEQAVMRTSLLPNLLAALARNLNVGEAAVRLFEVGAAFFPRGEGELPDEPGRVAGVIAGPRPGWLTGAGEVDFFDAKGVVEELLGALVGDRGASFEAARAAPMHPGIGARVTLSDGTEVGEVGEIHPAVREAFGIEIACFGFELALDRFPHPTPRQMKPLPRYPAVTRDLSFFVGAGVPAARVRALIDEADEPLVESVSVLEDYRDPSRVPEGQKGMLWSITYRSPERTLTDVEVDAAHEAIARRVLDGLPATRR